MRQAQGMDSAYRSGPRRRGLLRAALAGPIVALGVTLLPVGLPPGLGITERAYAEGDDGTGNSVSANSTDTSTGAAAEDSGDTAADSGAADGGGHVDSSGDYSGGIGNGGIGSVADTTTGASQEADSGGSGSIADGSAANSDYNGNVSDVSTADGTTADSSNTGSYGGDSYNGSVSDVASENGTTGESSYNAGTDNSATDASATDADGSAGGNGETNAESSDGAAAAGGEGHVDSGGYSGGIGNGGIGSVVDPAATPQTDFVTPDLSGPPVTEKVEERAEVYGPTVDPGQFGWTNDPQDHTRTRTETPDPADIWLPAMPGTQDFYGVQYDQSLYRGFGGGYSAKVTPQGFDVRVQLGYGVGTSRSLQTTDPEIKDDWSLNVGYKNKDPLGHYSYTWDYDLRTGTPKGAQESKVPGRGGGSVRGDAEITEQGRHPGTHIQWGSVDGGYVQVGVSATWDTALGPDRTASQPGGPPRDETPVDPTFEHNYLTEIDNEPVHQPDPSLAEVAPGDVPTTALDRAEIGLEQDREQTAEPEPASEPAPRSQPDEPDTDESSIQPSAAEEAEQAPATDEIDSPADEPAVIGDDGDEGCSGTPDACQPDSPLSDSPQSDSPQFESSQPEQQSDLSQPEQQSDFSQSDSQEFSTPVLSDVDAEPSFGG